MSKEIKIQFIEELPADPMGKLLIVLFHGYGADAYDLKTLSQVITPPSGQDTHWAFGQGPLKVPIGPGWMGRAWWPINIQEYQNSLASEAKNNKSGFIPDNIEQLRTQIFDSIKQKGYSMSKVILGGFSQGAMLATDLFLNSVERPKALIVLSGALINKAQWAEQAKALKGNENIFISHGDQDPVIPAKEADRLETFFSEFKVKPTKFLFKGTHEIPPEVIERINLWLKKIDL